MERLVYCPPNIGGPLGTYQLNIKSADSTVTDRQKLPQVSHVALEEALRQWFFRCQCDRNRDVEQADRTPGQHRKPGRIIRGHRSA